MFYGVQFATEKTELNFPFFKLTVSRNLDMRRFQSEIWYSSCNWHFPLVFPVIDWYFPYDQDYWISPSQKERKFAFYQNDYW